MINFDDLDIEEQNTNAPETRDHEATTELVPDDPITELAAESVTTQQTASEPTAAEPMITKPTAAEPMSEPAAGSMEEIVSAVGDSEHFEPSNQAEMSAFEAVPAEGEADAGVKGLKALIPSAWRLRLIRSTISEVNLVSDYTIHKDFSDFIDQFATLYATIIATTAADIAAKNKRYRVSRVEVLAALRQLQMDCLTNSV